MKGTRVEIREGNKKSEFDEKVRKEMKEKPIRMDTKERTEKKRGG